MSPYGSKVTHVCPSCGSLKMLKDVCSICNGGVMEEFVTLEMYWMGRDTEFASELTQEIRDNAARLCVRVNELLTALGWKRPCKVNSGWRPPSINAKLGGKPGSKHQLALAVDLSDEDGALDALLCENAEALRGRGMAIEDPTSTPKWSHIQLGLPKSGNVVFKP